MIANTTSARGSSLHAAQTFHRAVQQTWCETDWRSRRIASLRLWKSCVYVGGPRGQTVGNIDYEAWAKVLDVNTLGPLRVSETFVDNVARSERKLIVTLTSGMGSIADNTSGGAFAYRSSKAAVNMVMRSLAVDLAPRGVTCVVINPGWVRTDMGGPHGTQTPAESIAKLRRLIEDLGRDQSGKFFNHDGREFAW